MSTNFFELHEAQLFRLLKGFFGEEQVVPFLTLRMICGEAAAGEAVLVDGAYLQERCLLTVLDQQSTPHLVVEFARDHSVAVDVAALNRDQAVQACLARYGILYITISHDEFAEVLDPVAEMSLVRLLQSKLDENPVTEKGVG